MSSDEDERMKFLHKQVMDAVVVPSLMSECLCLLNSCIALMLIDHTRIQTSASGEDQ